MNEAANNSARVSRQDRKIPPAQEKTNQIAGFEGFRELASLEKNDIQYYHLAVRIRTCRAIFIFLLREKKRFRTVSKLSFGSAFPVFITRTVQHSVKQFSVCKQSAVYGFETSNYLWIIRKCVWKSYTDRSPRFETENQPRKDFTCVLICCSCIRRSVWALSLAKKFKNKNIDKDKDYQTIV